MGTGRRHAVRAPIPTPGHEVIPPGAMERLRGASAAGDPERILEVFLAEVIELPPEAIEAMRNQAHPGIDQDREQFMGALLAFSTNSERRGRATPKGRSMASEEIATG